MRNMLFIQPNLNSPDVWPCSQYERSHYVDNPACHICMVCDRALGAERCWVALHGWEYRVSIQELVKGFLCAECAEKDRKERRNLGLKYKRAHARGAVSDYRKPVAYGTCRQCDHDYIIKKRGQSYCSAKCRVTAWRKAKVAAVIQPNGQDQAVKA
jgi:hypothetical protein